MTRTCLECSAPITKNAAGWCKPCAARVNGRRNADKVPDPIPDGFAEFAAGKPLIDLAYHYGKCRRTIQRWRAQLGMPDRVERGAPPPSRPVPDSFALVAPGKSIKELCKHYTAGHRSIERWLKQTGIKRGTARTATKRIGGPNPLATLNPVGHEHRDFSVAGQAADFLRRLGPVVRCDAAGRFDPKGDHWRRGSGLPLTADEVIARATRNGWAPDAWARIAA
jgi:hypothetical protein